MLVVMTGVTQATHDKQQVVPALEAFDAVVKRALELGVPTTLVGIAGFAAGTTPMPVGRSALSPCWP